MLLELRKEKRPSYFGCGGDRRLSLDEIARQAALMGFLPTDDERMARVYALNVRRNFAGLDYATRFWGLLELRQTDTRRDLDGWSTTYHLDAKVMWWYRFKHRRYYRNYAANQFDTAAEFLLSRLG